MRKGPYFLIQAIFSIVITSLIWFMMFNFLDVAVNDMETLSGATFSPFIVLILGGIFYLILTIIYIVIGAKKIDDWRPWMIAVNIAIHIVMFFLGFLGASYFTALTAPNLLT